VIVRLPAADTQANPQRTKILETDPDFHSSSKEEVQKQEIATRATRTSL
jgi:hypothetical protein